MGLPATCWRHHQEKSMRDDLIEKLYMGAALLFIIICYGLAGASDMESELLLLCAESPGRQECELLK